MTKRHILAWLGSSHNQLFMNMILFFSTGFIVISFIGFIVSILELRLAVKKPLQEVLWLCNVPLDRSSVFELQDLSYLRTVDRALKT